MSKEKNHNETSGSSLDDAKSEAIFDQIRVVCPEMSCKSGNKIIKVCTNLNCKSALQCG